MTTGPIAASVGKVEAVRDLAARAGLAEFDAHGPGVAETLAAVGRVLRRLSNPQVELREAAQIAEMRSWLAFGAGERVLAAPLHLSGMPGCFSDGSPNAHSPEFRLIELPGGYFCHYPDSPLVVSAQGDIVASDLSSRFAGLVHYYETSLRHMLADVRRIDGTLIAIADDVRPANYCHWIVNWLPRLAPLGEHLRWPDTFVAVPPLTAAYQWETLRLCGIPPERVVQLDVMQGVAARRLLLPGDLAGSPHPGHKAAPWVLGFVRAALGYGAFLAGGDGPPRRRKLYVSRADAPARRVLNEPALIDALAPLGYEPVSLTGLPATQQFALFASASHIVALHGAGLANVVFADPAATLVEIFPASYGTAAYYVLSAGLGMTYASYICDRITVGSRPQLDDISIDIDDFLARARHLL